MARKRESGLDTIAALPWPIGIALGLIGFWTVRYGAGWWLSSRGGELGAALGQQLNDGSLAPLAWIVLAICWIAAGVSFLRGRRRAQLLETQTGVASIAALSWREFEQLVGEAFRRQGYLVEETGQGGADGGVDLILRKDGRTTLMQCKQWRQRHVPVTTVREMLGLLTHHGAHDIKIVCVGDYTPDARKFADGKAIELITGENLLTMVNAAQQDRPPIAVPRTDPVYAPVAPPDSPADPPQACPKCSSPMAQRMNRQTGAPFWGCTDFPRCRGTRAA